MILENIKTVLIVLAFFQLTMGYAQFGNNEMGLSVRQQENLADSMLGKANECFIRNQDSALILYDEVLSLYTKLGNSKGQMICLSRLAVLYDNIGNSDTALSIAYRAIGIGVENSYDTLLAETYLRLGTLYKEVGAYDKSKEFYYKTIDIGLPNTMNGAWGGLGILYSNMEEYDSAKIYLERSMQYFQNQDTNEQIIMFNIASLYGSIGINCFDRNKPIEGLRNFEESLRISRKIGNKVNIISNLLNLSIAYDMSDMPQKAEMVLQEAYQLADSMGNQKLKARVFLLMSDHYYEVAKFKLAYDYLNRYHNLNDSLGRVDFKNSLHENEIKYLQQIQEIELNRMELEKERTTLRFIIIIGVSSILFILITVFLFRKVKKKTEEKIQLEDHSKMLDISLKEARSRLAEINKHLEEQNKLILKLQQESIGMDKKEVSDIEKELENQKILLNDDWEKYMETFSVLHPNFLPNIIKRFENLTEGDKRQLIMIKLGYDRKKSALILGISPDSIKRAQQRLAKKLKLKDVTELKGFVSTF